MWFPKYWSKGRASGLGRDGKTLEVSCWGFSDSSLEDAARQGRLSASKVIERLGKNVEKSHYGYPDRPLREEVLQELVGTSDEFKAVVTRNAYGCTVLNTQGLMFIDVDLPEITLTWWSKLLGARRKLALAEAETLGHIRAWMGRNLEWGLRVYRTRNGFRLLCTHAAFDPVDERTHALMKDFGVDPLYAKLCRTQKSFRARLSPKPWRIGMPEVPARFPFENEAERQRFSRWEKDYEKLADRYATCRLVDTLGSVELPPAVRLSVELHDRLTKAESSLPLA